MQNFKLKDQFASKSCTKIGKVTIRNTDNGMFVFKELDQDIITSMQYLYNKNFNNIPNYQNIDGYLVYPYLDEIDVPIEVKTKDMMKCLASLHKKTSYFKKVDIDYIKAIYEHNKNKILKTRSLYVGYMDYSNTAVYQSPFQYYLARNFKDIVISIDRALQVLEKWYEMLKEERKLRYCFIHGNVMLEHFIKSDIDYFISWDNSRYDLPITDLYYYVYKSGSVSQVNDGIEEYLSYFELLPEEVLLFCSLILVPKLLNENSNEFELCCSLNDIIERSKSSFKFVDKLLGNYDQQLTTNE